MSKVSAANPKRCIKCFTNSFIFFAPDKSDLRMFLLKFFDDRRAFICTFIVDYNKFVIPVGLTKNGLQTFDYITLMIKACANDRDLWL